MRRVLVAAGVLVMGFAAWGAISDGDVNLVGVLLFLAAVVVLHDLIFLPLVLGSGALVGRLVPRRYRGVVRAAGVTTFATAVVAAPLLAGFGRAADNPSLLPGDYGPALAGILALVWLASLGFRFARAGDAQRRLGLVAGLGTGLVVAFLQAGQGMMAIDATGLSPGAGVAVVVTVIGSGVIGSFLRYRPHRLPALVTTGVLAGLLWWAVEWLTVLPLLAGHQVTWSLADAQAAFGFLTGSMLQGAVTAVVVHLASAARGPEAESKPSDGTRRRVVIVGGGFAGVSVAQRLERRLSGRTDVEIVLVSDSNYQLFTPMLAGVAGGTLQERHIGAPIRAALRRTVVRHAALQSIDTAARRLEIRTEGGLTTSLDYDQLVLAVGSVPDFRDLPGVERHAFPLKTLSHAAGLRDHLIRQLELADGAPAGGDRRRRLTVVVAGGGFAGVELIAELRDMMHAMRRYFPQLDPAEFRFVLVHSQDRILPELAPRLAGHALRRLRAKRIEFRLSARVAEVTESGVTLDDGDVIEAATVVWTAGNAPNPIVRRFGFELEHGGLACEPTMRVRGEDRVWALGDCAAIPDPAGGWQPPTAQHALREGKALADNIVAVLDGGEPRPFRFRTIAQLVALGHQDGAAQIGGRLLSGRLAWALWRGVYLAKLPGTEKKAQVAIDWSLDLVFPRDVVLTAPPSEVERVR